MPPRCIARHGARIACQHASSLRGTSRYFIPSRGSQEHRELSVRDEPHFVFNGRGTYGRLALSAAADLTVITSAAARAPGGARLPGRELLVPAIYRQCYAPPAGLGLSG